MAAREPAGGSSPRRYLPVSQPPASGLHGITPMPCRWQAGSTASSMPRAKIEYCGCSQTKRSRPRALGRPLRLHDPVGRIGRRAEVQHLALPHEVGEGAERLVEVGAPVEAVHLVEVDVVGAEAAQAVLAGLPDPPP